MDVIEKKTVDMLTTDNVSILTQNFIDLDGKQEQVGSNHRCAYVNSENGRQNLQDNEPEEVVTAVMAICGDYPTVFEEVVENSLE